MEFSVLMSVYYKEDSKNLKAALESTLDTQSVCPSELVLVKDGILTDELNEVIIEFEKKYPRIMKTIQLDENVGLGRALNIGLKNCNFELVARMDSDDINVSNRFEKQLEIFNINRDKDISLVGGHILEFYEDPKNIRSKREVPVNDIEFSRMIKKRNPINHVTVMFKKTAVIDSGGYMHLPYLEDYFLWIRMFQKGYNLLNIDSPLVYVRTGENMFKRRGNKEIIKSWIYLQKVLKNYKIINTYREMINILEMFLFTLIPANVRKIIYNKLLRTNNF